VVCVTRRCRCPCTGWAVLSASGRLNRRRHRGAHRTGPRRSRVMAHADDTRRGHRRCAGTRGVSGQGPRVPLIERHLRPGGAGYLFRRLDLTLAQAVVSCQRPLAWSRVPIDLWAGDGKGQALTKRLRVASIASALRGSCSRLSRQTGGTPMRMIHPHPFVAPTVITHTHERPLFLVRPQLLTLV
jgi:hypothetical protein